MPLELHFSIAGDSDLMDRWSPNFFVGLGVFYRDFVLHAGILAHLPHNNILAYKK